MRKVMMAITLSLISSSAFAADVKISSFIYVNKERRLAELCGRVTSAPGPSTFVQITVDERSKRPATYNTFAGPTGKFCAVVVTYYGTAIAEAL
jgi:hypothetical protein